MPGAGAWIRPYRDGFRVYYRKEPSGKLGGSRVFPTRAGAEALADELRAQITTKRRTVADALDAYRKDMEARERSDVAATDAKLRRMLSDVLDSPLSVLTPRRADALCAKLAASSYAPSTQAQTLKLAKAWATWCAHPKRRWWKESPFATVDAIGKVADRRSECLRVDEARAFREKAIELAAREPSAVMPLVVLTCSLRPSEVVQIEVRDVDDGGAVLWIAGKRLKTANTRRPIEVADERLRALLVRAARGKAPTDRIFPVEQHTVTAWCKRVATAARVPMVDARMLRRTFASLSARQGRSLDDLAFSMGHGADASARTAQRHYIAPGAREAGAAGRVLGVLDGGKPTKSSTRTA